MIGYCEIELVFFELSARIKVIELCKYDSKLLILKGFLNLKSDKKYGL
jgi:hypothetical protein